MMTTCRPSAEIWSGHDLAERGPVALRQELHRLVDAAELAAGDPELAGVGGADREDDRVEALGELRAGQRGAVAGPISTPQRKTVPSRSICRSRRSRNRFSILNSGMP